MSRPRKNTAPDQLRMLALVRDGAPGPRSATVMSTAAIARALGCSAGKVKLLRRALVEEGLLTVEQRFLPNGGQTENAFRLTRAGRRRLENAEPKVIAPTLEPAPQTESANAQN